MSAGLGFAVARATERSEALSESENSISAGQAANGGITGTALENEKHVKSYENSRYTSINRQYTWITISKTRTRV